MTTSETALVFSIQRFSVHDGAGIRTTIFFKGCPLRCLWCQNPEGLDKEKKPIWLESRCIQCGTCAGQRNERVMEACPAAAIQYDAKEYTVEALMEEIRKDRVFYGQRGGVTFSGGEPLMQGGFLEKLVKACKSEQIHTAIETSLMAEGETVRAILPQLDQIFCDLKVLDEENHRQWTGFSNRQILENMDWLLKTADIQEKMTVRTPLIRGLTGTKENVAAISAWLKERNPQVQYELLNTNPLAPAKYGLAGKTWLLDKPVPFSQKEMEQFQALI